MCLLEVECGAPRGQKAAEDLRPSDPVLRGDRAVPTDFVEMEWSDLSLFLTHQLTEIHEQLVLLRDEKKRHSAAFGNLITERQNAVSAV